MSWGNWRTAFAAEVEEVGGSTRHPERGPAMQPGKGQDGQTSHPPSKQERLHPDREGSPDTLPAMPPQYATPDPPPPRPGTEVRTDMRPRSWEECQ